MTDYTKLVEALRICSSELNCGDCPLLYRDSCSSDELMSDAAAAIEELQAEVPKRGEWIARTDVAPFKPDGEITSWTYRCSKCGKLERLKQNYCPNCGAKMGGTDADS